MAVNRSMMFAVAILGIFAISVLAVQIARKIVVGDSSSSTKDGGQDFFMIDATYTKFDQRGEVSSEIRAKKVTHRMEKNRFYFEAPKIVISGQNEYLWHINSRKGMSEEGKEKIYLWDDVTISRKENKKQRVLDISMDSLGYYPRSKFAETKGAVKIVEHDSVITATGAAVDFKTAIVKLISDVRAVYSLS